MDKYTGFAQDSSGNLITSGTPTIRVTAANSDTLVPIYSSDSLAAAKSNPFTLPASGKIEFHTRNQKVRIKMTNGGVETPLEEVVMNAGVRIGTFAARPAAGSADLIYVAYDTGRIYEDDGTVWKEIPDYTLSDLPLSAIPDAAISGGNPMLNGTLVASVAGNALTLAIKTLAGTDPTPTDPVLVLLRNTTPATGTYSLLALTAATSIVVSSGSTLGTVNNIPFRFWVTMFNDAGVARMGVINCLATSAGPGAGRRVDSVYPLAQFPIASSTAEGGAGGADSAQVFYTGNAVTSKPYAVLGYATYEAGLVTAGTYASTPTRLELFHRGVPLPGTVIQCPRSESGAVATGTTAFPDDDTIPQITEGDQYLSQAIVPSSAANVLVARHVGHYAHSGTVALIAAALFQDATANALAAQEGGRDGAANARTQIKLWHRFLALVNVSTTLRIRAGNSTGATTTFNGAAAGRKYGGVMSSFLEVEEVMG